MISRHVVALSLAASMMALTSHVAMAADNEIRVVGAYGLQFLPTYVAIDKKLIEKHAVELGIADPKVTFNWVSNGGAINDAIISDSSDIGQVPGPALVLLWNKNSRRASDPRRSRSLRDSADSTDDRPADQNHRRLYGPGSYRDGDRKDIELRDHDANGGGAALRVGTAKQVRPDERATRLFRDDGGVVVGRDGNQVHCYCPAL